MEYTGMSAPASRKARRMMRMGRGISRLRFSSTVVMTFTRLGSLLRVSKKNMLYFSISWRSLLASRYMLRETSTAGVSVSIRFRLVRKASTSSVSGFTSRQMRG